ncbi:MAG: RNA polymerase sigma-70 factor [Mediterranea sp.]|jgi:RNA polymerase sigma-70 factor (ECF subfamily)|nr:RNA polymerase sigma-70 factor [Mediterranea sp.]
MKNAINISSLFEEIANDDPRAFQLFFDFTYSKAYRYANYFVNDPDACKDILSDVYAYIWKNRRKLPEVENYENYLFICVRNQSLNHLKIVSRHQKIRLDDVNVQNMSDGSASDRYLLDEELKNILELAVNSLPSKCRLIFFLIREEGMTYKDVAEVLSLSERTVQGQLRIASRRLGLIVKEYIGNLKTGKHYEKIG